MAKNQNFGFSHANSFNMMAEFYYLQFRHQFGLILMAKLENSKLRHQQGLKRLKQPLLELFAALSKVIIQSHLPVRVEQVAEAGGR